MAAMKVLLLAAGLGWVGALTLMRTHDTMPVPESKKLQLSIPDIAGANVSFKVSSSTLGGGKIAVDPMSMLHRLTPAVARKAALQKRAALKAFVVRPTRGITRKPPTQLAFKSPASRIASIYQRPVVVRRSPAVRPARKALGFHIRHGIIVNRATGRVSRVITGARHVPLPTAAHRPWQSQGNRRAPVAGRPKFAVLATRGMAKFLPPLLRRRPFLRKGQDEPTDTVVSESFTAASGTNSADLASTANQIDLNSDSVSGGLTATETVGSRGGEAAQRVIGYRADGSAVFDPSATINPNTPIRVVGYNVGGEPIEVIDYLDEDLPQGGPSDVVGYDANGQPLYGRPPQGDGSAGSGMENSGPRAEDYVDPNAPVGYDADGNPVYNLPSTADAGGDSSQVVGYDANGNPVTSDEVATDTNGNPVADTNTAQPSTDTGVDSNVIGYDADGNPVTADTISDQPVIGYDADGNPVTADTTSDQTIIGYDADGNPVTGDTSSDQTIIGYDADGNPVAGDTASDQQVVGYDADGNPITSGDLAYDEKGEPVETGDDSEQDIVGYDENGDPIFASPPDTSELPPITDTPPAQDTTTTEEYSEETELTVATEGTYQNLAVLQQALSDVEENYATAFAQEPADPDTLADSPDADAIANWLGKAAAFSQTLAAQQPTVDSNLALVRDELESVGTAPDGVVAYFELKTKYETVQVSPFADNAAFQQLRTSFDDSLTATTETVAAALADLDELRTQVSVISNAATVMQDALESADAPEDKSDVIARELPQVDSAKEKLDQLVASLSAKLKDLQNRRDRVNDLLDVMIAFRPDAEVRKHTIL